MSKGMERVIYFKYSVLLGIIRKQRTNIQINPFSLKMFHIRCSSGKISLALTNNLYKMDVANRKPDFFSML